MKLQNLILLGGLGYVAYMIYQKSKATPTPTPPKTNTNTLQVESKPETPVSEEDVVNAELLNPTKRKVKEQMTDVVMGGDKMCFNAMKF